MPRLINAKTLLERAKVAMCGNRVIFHHVPKCGGTSIYRALRMRYAISYAYVDIRAISEAIEVADSNQDTDASLDKSLQFREILLLYLINRDTFCIAGHIPFSLRTFEWAEHRYKFITTLRNPVDFFLSFYFFNLRSNVERWRISLPLDEFLETERARQFGEFYVRFFCGESPHREIPSDRAKEMALANLKKFDLVGLVEDMPTFQRRLRDLLDTRLTIGHENQARLDRNRREQTVTPEMRRKIEEISAPNIEIYEHARATLGT